MVRVLLADDHPVTRLGLRALFTSTPRLTLVGEEADGAAALAACRALRPDVAVLDLRLPKLTALEILEQLAGDEPPTRVIVLTAQSGLELARRARTLGAAGYLTKDTPPERLVRAVLDVAAGGKAWPHELRVSLEAEPDAALSPRELEVLAVLATGASNKDIAQRLGLSEGTVRIHLSNIFAKLGVGDRTSAVTLALKRGLVQL